MTGVPKIARGKIYLARDIHRRPNIFAYFARPASLYCEENTCLHNLNA
jgi:hypothetical protein